MVPRVTDVRGLGRGQRFHLVRIPQGNAGQQVRVDWWTNRYGTISFLLVVFSAYGGISTVLTAYSVADCQALTRPQYTDLVQYLVGIIKPSLKAFQAQYQAFETAKNLSDGLGYLGVQSSRKLTERSVSDIASLESKMYKLSLNMLYSSFADN